VQELDIRIIPVYAAIAIQHSDSRLI